MKKILALGLGLSLIMEIFVATADSFSSTSV